MRTRLKSKKETTSGASAVPRGPYKVHIEADKTDILRCFNGLLPAPVPPCPTRPSPVSARI